MVGSSFKKGYVCSKCFNDRRYGVSTETPLYTRDKKGFKYSGFVLCPIHGPQPGKPAVDLDYVRYRDTNRD